MISMTLVITAIALQTFITPVGYSTFDMNGTTYGQWQVPATDVGWHNTSALPGEVGNTVFNGHSTTAFSNLRDVTLGDEVLVGDDLYHVQQVFLVKDKGVPLEQRIANASRILPTEDRRLTMITCAGWNDEWRLIIVAR